MQACQRHREEGRDRSDAATDLEHTAHAEALDLAERIERDLRELLDEAGEGSGDERSRSGRDLSVDEYEREQRVVDELVDLCCLRSVTLGQSATGTERHSTAISSTRTFRLVRLVPIDLASKHALSDDARDVGTLSLHIVVKQDFVELIGHVEEHLDVGRHVDLECGGELVDQARDDCVANVAQVRHREEDSDVLQCRSVYV